MEKLIHAPEGRGVMLKLLHKHHPKTLNCENLPLQELQNGFFLATCKEEKEWFAGHLAVVSERLEFSFSILGKTIDPMELEKILEYVVSGCSFYFYSKDGGDPLYCLLPK